MSTSFGGEESLEVAVALGLVGGVVVPAAPEDADPGAAEDAQGVGMVGAAAAGALVDVAGPGVVVAGGVGQGADGFAQAFVAGAAEAGGFLLAGFDGDGAHAGVGGQAFGGGVAVAAVADLGQEGGGADAALGVAEEALEDWAVVVGLEGVGDLAGEPGDLGHQDAERGDQAEDDRAAGFAFGLAGVALRGVAEAFDQDRGVLAAGVRVAGQEATHAGRAEALGVVAAGVALQEGQRDGRVQVGKQRGGAGPEAVELGAQPVGLLDAAGDEVLAGAGERAQRLAGVAVRLQ